MAAFFESGFSVRTPMWHGLGNVLDDYPIDWADARRKAGLEWEPVIQPCYIKYPEPRLVPVIRCAADGCGSTAGFTFDSGSFECAACGVVTEATEYSEFGAAPKHRIVTRSDNYNVLGVVSDQYSLVYHSQMGDILEAILEAGEGNLRFETAGSIKGGAHVWALVYLDEPVNVAGDDSGTLPFMALLNAHDGSGAVKCIYTDVRIVCWNTYSMASFNAEQRRTQYVFRHVGNMSEKIEEAKLAMRGLRAHHGEWIALAEQLYKYPVDDAKVREFTELFFPEPPGEVKSDRVMANIVKARTAFTSYYNFPQNDAHRGTALGVIETAVEYLDHVRDFQSASTQMGRTLLRPEPLKGRALAVLRDVMDLSTLGAN